MRRFFALLSLLGAAALATGCVKKAPPSLGTPPPACPLATDEDLTATLGAKFSKTAEAPLHPNPLVSICQLKAEGVALTVRTESLERSAFDKDVQALGGGEVVPDLGDAAYFHAMKGTPMTIGTFLVLKGNTMLSLTYLAAGIEEATALAAEKALAARLLSKI